MKLTAKNRDRSSKKKARRLIEQNRHREALPLLEALCRSGPKDGEAWLMLGATYGHLGNLQAAIHCSEQAAILMPASIQVLDNLALGYQLNGEIGKACSVWERRLALDPRHRDTVKRLVQGLMTNGQTDKAVVVCQQYLDAHPNDFELSMNLGIAHEFEGALSKAECCYRRALELQPGHSIVLQNLANVLSAQGRIDAALDAYRESLQSDPGNAIARSNYLLNLHYKPELTAEEISREHIVRMRYACRSESARTFGNELDSRRPLRIGFLSPDMRTHSVAYFFEALLGGMGRSECISYCYADVARPDAASERLRRLSSHWRGVAGLDIAGICSRIRGDKIDILVDLAGHTSSRNMAVFSASPAPVQVTWLGYPNTTGLRCMDYRFTDNYADPVEDSTPGTEALVRLEGSFLCYMAPPGAPEVATLPAKINRYVTFGSFNNLAKINDRVLELWVRLLGRVANSRLYLKNPSFTDEATRETFRTKLIDMGVASDRISLVGRTRSPEEHLQLYSEIDIGLDTFPYNGTTTSCEALWMGVPVVTKAGHAHLGRVGVSLLQAVNHAEWVARDDEAYTQIAAALASNIDALARTRDTLRDDMRNSSLCDAERFSTGFMQALREIWVKQCASAAR